MKETTPENRNHLKGNYLQKDPTPGLFVLQVSHCDASNKKNMWDRWYCDDSVHHPLQFIFNLLFRFTSDFRTI